MPRAIQIARQLKADDLGPLAQEDVYFHCPFGCLKIRRINESVAGELVAYRREDQPQAKISNYEVVHVSDAVQLREALEMTLGVRVIVRKTRHLFLWKNIRIHLDQVEGLGSFIEFEAVLVDEGDEEDAARDLASLQEKFQITSDDLLSGSYSEMLLVSQIEKQNVCV